MISALTRVSFERNFIRFLSEIHGMRQNSQNSKRKTKMNEMKQFNHIVNPLTIIKKTYFTPLYLLSDMKYHWQSHTLLDSAKVI